MYYLDQLFIHYTPIHAHEKNYDTDNNNNNGDVVHPSYYIKQYRNIPKSIQDQSLINFYHETSVYYHQSRSSSYICIKNNNNKNKRTRNNNKIIDNGLDGKNTSGKPSSHGNIKSNFESWAILLVGGGYYSSTSTVGPTTTGRKNQHTTITNTANNPSRHFLVTDHGGSVNNNSSQGHRIIYPKIPFISTSTKGETETKETITSVSSWRKE